jgi:hypothetical protein
MLQNRFFGEQTAGFPSLKAGEVIAKTVAEGE